MSALRKACLRIMLLGSTLTILSSTAAAQGGEIFGGYSYLRSSSASGYNTNGWEGSLTGNFNRFLGVEVDLSDHYNTPPGLTSYSNGLNFLFGPHFAYRGIPRINPFVHFLAGGTRGSHQPPAPLAQQNLPTVSGPCPAPGCPVLGPLQQTAFTAGLGGGVDLKASRFLWIRLIQADYLREYFSHDTQNDARISFGVVLRFGR